MAKKLQDKETVSLEELLLSNIYTQEALINILDKKGLLKKDEVLEEIKMERANAINYRKRLEKQRDEFADVASSRILSKLISVKDDLNRIIKNGKDDIPADHMKGIELLLQRVDGMFDSEGVSISKIESGKTRYDPNKHEAIMAIPTDDLKPNIIMDLVTNGVIMKERVLKAAQVVISKGLPKAKEEPP